MPLDNADELIREFRAECAKAVVLISGDLRCKEADVLSLIECLRIFNDRSNRFHSSELQLVDKGKLRAAAARIAQEVTQAVFLEARVEDPAPRRELTIVGPKMLLSMSVDELQLSTRVGNCLRIGRIYTVRELVLRSSEDLLRIRCFGRNSLNEVNVILNAQSLRLGMTEEQVQQIANSTPQDTRESIEQTLREPLSKFGLGCRALHAARLAGAGTLGDLARLTENQLFAQRNFGEMSLRQIKQLLARYQLRLGITEEEISSMLEEPHGQ